MREDERIKEECLGVGSGLPEAVLLMGGISMTVWALDMSFYASGVA